MILLFALGLVVMVVVHVVLQRRLAKECTALLEREDARRAGVVELDEARHKLLYKQQKESARVVARSDRAVSSPTWRAAASKGRNGPFASFPDPFGANDYSEGANGLPVLASETGGGGAPVVSKLPALGVG